MGWCIDSCFIAKILLELNKEVFKEDYVSREEVYELRILLQCEIDKSGLDITILDELDERIFEERNGICFYVGDKTGTRMEVNSSNFVDYLCLMELIVISKKDIIKCISDFRHNKLEKIEALTSE